MTTQVMLAKKQRKRIVRLTNKDEYEQSLSIVHEVQQQQQTAKRKEKKVSAADEKLSVTLSCDGR
jgi:Mg2+/citrate symporter